MNFTGRFPTLLCASTERFYLLFFSFSFSFLFHEDDRAGQRARKDETETIRWRANKKKIVYRCVSHFFWETSTARLPAAPTTCQPTIPALSFSRAQSARLVFQTFGFFPPPYIIVAERSDYDPFMPTAGKRKGKVSHLLYNNSCASPPGIMLCAARFITAAVAEINESAGISRGRR